MLQPTVSACHSVVCCLFCAENLEDPAASSFCMRQDIPETYLCFFLAHQQLQRPSLHFHITAVFQVICHCRLLPFPECSICSIALPASLATDFRSSKKLKRGVRGVIFYWRAFETHLSLFLFQLTLAFFGERKRTAFQQIPNPNPQETCSKHSVTEE